MESGTTLTVAELPEPAFISPSETVMAHSPSQRPMTLAGMGTSNLMSAGISVATSTPPILLNSAGPAFRILFLRASSSMKRTTDVRGCAAGANAAVLPRASATSIRCILRSFVLFSAFATRFTETTWFLASVK